MDGKSELNLKNKSYLKALDAFVWKAYELDIEDGDLTSESFLGKNDPEVTAVITAKEEGILAGIQEAKWFLNKIGIKIMKAKKDGDQVKKGEPILNLKGKGKSILKAERTLLNLLQRLSGIATKTKKLATKLPAKTTLLATRKTLWGALDKRAVTLGGGGTHRLSLSDAILIKENHIALSLNFKKNLESAFKKSPKVRFIEIELEAEVQVREFLKLYKDLKKDLPLEKDKIVVMLDDFKPREIKKVIPFLKKAGLTVEVSGGINEKTISRYFIKGVDAFSSGAITMAAKHLDLSLKIEKITHL